MTLDADHIVEALARTALLVRRDIFPTLAEEQIIEHLAGRRIRVLSDARNVEAAAGQTAVTATTLVLAQLGARLAIDVPDVSLRAPQPPLRTGLGLAEGLRDLCGDLIQPADLEPGAPVDLTVVIGTTRLPVASGAVLRAHGTAWEGNVTPDERVLGAPWTGDVPFGSMLAAQAVAAEAFRAAMVDLAVRFGVEPLPEHGIGAAGAVRLHVEALDLESEVDVGTVDAVSGGAITNSALSAMLRVRGLRALLRVIDDDIGAVSNLNRYTLLRASSLGHPKVNALETFGTTTFSIKPTRLRLTPETVAAIAPLAPRVLVGVDDIPSRWLSQAHAPGWLCVGGTSRMEIVVSEHPPNAPCAGCMHPYDDGAVGEIPTISFVSQLAGILQAHRLLHHATTGGALPAAVAYGLGLRGPRAILPLGQVARPDCPVGCRVSRETAA